MKYTLSLAAIGSGCTGGCQPGLGPGTGETKLAGEAEMKKLLVRLWKEQEGQDLTEYALLLVLIALAAITVMSNLGMAINNVFSTGASTLSSAST
jgi:pilus assembly protein Flp/PilA